MARGETLIPWSKTTYAMRNTWLKAADADRVTAGIDLSANM